MFRVGDVVGVIADDRQGVVFKINNNVRYPVYVRFDYGDWEPFLESDLVHTKEYKVLQILRQWQRSR